MSTIQAPSANFAAATSTATMPVVIAPTPLMIARRRQPGTSFRSRRQRRTMSTTAFALLATFALLFPGFGTDQPDLSLPSAFDVADGRLQYEATQIVPLLLIVAVGILFYVAGASTRRDMVQIPIAAEMGVEPPTA